MDNTYEISIKAMVEFLLRYGDISKRNTIRRGSERAQYGSLLHRKLQKEFSESKEYVKEAYLKYTFCMKGITLTVHGRADGYYFENDVLCVDEIKTVEVDLVNVEESDLVHLAQALSYAYILAIDDKRDAVINIIYYNIYTDETKTIKKFFTFPEIEAFFNNLCESYISWLSFDNIRHQKLKQQLSGLRFPFPSYREGQRYLATKVYKSIINKYKLFVQAPTGIGKTISVLFPSLKALGEDSGSKIFFLTSRNAGILAPQDTIKMMTEYVPDLSFVTLTAKEKICPNELNCDPSVCRYAKGHFDRINKAVYESINQYKLFSRELIEEIANRYTVCPFELGLDLSLWTDVVIGDYNYLFDPNAYLKRFFSEAGDYIFLIDEAHNLQDRTRDMYTQKLKKNSFSDLKKKFKNLKGGSTVYKSVSGIVNYFNKVKKNMGEMKYIVNETPDSDMHVYIDALNNALGEFLSNEGTSDEDIITLYMNCLFFSKLLDIYDNNFCYYISTENSGIEATIYLADPSKIIEETLTKGRSAVLFSGTLMPLSFYFSALGGNENDRTIFIPSPFPPENRLVLIGRDVSTTFKRRQYYYQAVAEYIKGLAALKKGNFLVFFSSYKYLSDVYSCIPQGLRDRMVIQPITQNPDEREQFIKDFVPDPEAIRIGLCVLGGIYSEGIDLAGDRLSGVIVVGVGLPQMCLERDIIKAVYERNDPGSGFMNAYVYPGINKVLQAAGRVIRTDTDRGFIVLLDERFTQDSYFSLLPQDMSPKILNNVNTCIDEIKKFIDT